IAAYAYYMCTGLTGTVEIPSTVTHIGSHAFDGVGTITDLRIHEETGFTNIHSDAFTDSSANPAIVFVIGQSGSTEEDLDDAWHSAVVDNTSHNLNNNRYQCVVDGTLNIILDLRSVTPTGDSDLDKIAQKYGTVIWANQTGSITADDAKNYYCPEAYKHYFMGWSRSIPTNGSANLSYTLSPSGTTFYYLYAYWKNSVKLVFDPNGATGLPSGYTDGVIIEYGSSYSDGILDSSPGAWPDGSMMTKTTTDSDGNTVNMTFSHWQHEDIVYRDYTDIYKYDNDAETFTLTAVWKVPFKIYFMNEVGDIISSCDLVAHATVDKDVAQGAVDRLNLVPGRRELAGWYKDIGYTKRFYTPLDSGNPSYIDSDAQNYYIYAKINTYYIISFNYMNPAGDTLSLNKLLKGSALTQDEIAKKTQISDSYYPGYHFEGWYEKDSNGNEVARNSFTYINADHDLYAKWRKWHTISFDYCYNDELEEVQVLDGEKVSKIPTEHSAGVRKLDNTVLPYGSKIFDGWYTEKEGGGTQLVDNNGEIMLKSGGTYTEYPVEDDAIYYANWVDAAIITFHRMGGSETIKTMKVRKGEKVSLSEAPVWEDDEYVFVGWYTEPDGGGTEFVDGTLATGDLDLFAYWKKADPIYYTVTFEMNGGPDIESQRVLKGNTAKKPSTPVRVAYNFKGWYKDKKFKKEFDFTTPITEDTTIYARWVAVGEPGAEDDEDDLADKAEGRRVIKIALVKKEKVDISSYFAAYSSEFAFYDNSNSYAASVSKKGKVKAKHEGTARIDGYFKSGNQVPVVVKITVVDQQLSVISLSQGNCTVSACDYLTYPGLKPDKWILKCKPTVAQIHPTTGVIKVHKGGRATIIAQYSKVKVKGKLKVEIPILETSALTMKTGYKKKIKVSGVKRKDLTFISASDNVATVDAKGKITAVSAGSVNITVSMNNGTKVVMKVNVTPPVIKTPSIVVKIGQKKKIKMTSTKLKNFEWKCANEEVALVDYKGYVYGLSPGQTTATTVTGGGKNTCRIVVTY
nr:InlB B-repeat-containing protein [Lachnospiraceae bacterium]